MEIKKGDPIAWYCSYRPQDKPDEIKQYTLSDYGTVIATTAFGVTIEWVGLNGGGSYKETHSITEYNENFRYDRAEARERKIKELFKKDE